MTTDNSSDGRSELGEVIARLMKGVRDPEAGRKAREEMDLMREETRRRIGIVDIAVGLIREARN